MEGEFAMSSGIGGKLASELGGDSLPFLSGEDVLPGEDKTSGKPEEAVTFDRTRHGGKWFYFVVLCNGLFFGQSVFYFMVSF